MTGPFHYKKAEEILPEIQAANAASKQIETALAIQAHAHAILALAAYRDRPGLAQARVARRRRGQVRGYQAAA